MEKNKNFKPDWTNLPPENESYRSVFKYGDPEEFKHPNDEWFTMLKEDLGMADEDFKEKKNQGRSPIELNRPVTLTREQVSAIGEIVGKENTDHTDYNRVRYAHGKTTEEMMELGRGIIREVADLVVHPRSKEDVQKLVIYCNEQNIPIYVFSGGSSVNFGVRPEKGGVTLVMSTHMNRLLSLSRENQTATVQPGMYGPAYEDALNRSPELFGTKLKYTCGHFPQSFEYSTVGGWVVTLGSGQASTYYGDAGDLVISQEYVTPTGSFKTLDYPATATGPKVSDMMKGSEGTFGILVEVTMKIFRHMPENRRYFSFMFPTWEDAVNASREIAQGEFGLPAVFRISDPEETDRGLKLYGIPPLFKKLLARLGYKEMERCLCLGTVEGDADYTRLVKGKIRAVCKSHGAIRLGGYGTMKWEKTRYKEPYMREDLNDYGITIDTLEASVTWENLHRLHRGVREYIKSRPNTMCMTHASHFYPQGTNLYFIFVGRFRAVDEYRKFQGGIIDKIQENGGSLSHHHGVGRMIAPWMEAHLGKEQMDVLRALKKHFDPKGIMNPGGQLGLNLPQNDEKE